MGALKTERVSVVDGTASEVLWTKTLSTAEMIWIRASALMHEGTTPERAFITVRGIFRHDGNSHLSVDTAELDAYRTEAALDLQLQVANNQIELQFEGVSGMSIEGTIEWQILPQG